ncbi:MAG: photosynthetic reaction center cytochrome c subunit family protein [Acidobacteriota bacterium]
MKALSTAILILMAAAPLVTGQAPAQPREPLPNMQAIAEALGVQCEYCHSAARGSGLTEPKKDIARQMLAMTREMNTRVSTATGKVAGQATRVDCVTCHRGVPIPKQLPDLIFETALKQSGAAAVEQYRDLRTRFFGRQAYDFGENTLISVSQRLANVRPDDAILLTKLNIEFFPNSSASYAALAYAHTRKVDDASAIAALEKAVELDPSNNVARGQLEQLKSYQRRR